MQDVVAYFQSCGQDWYPRSLSRQVDDPGRRAENRPLLTGICPNLAALNALASYISLITKMSNPQSNYESSYAKSLYVIVAGF